MTKAAESHKVHRLKATKQVLVAAETLKVHRLLHPIQLAHYPDPNI